MRGRCCLIPGPPLAPQHSLQTRSVAPGTQQAQQRRADGVHPAAPTIKEDSREPRALSEAHAVELKALARGVWALSSGLAAHFSV